MSILYLYDDLFLQHETGDHPENKGRLIAINQLLNRSPINSLVVRLTPRAASRDDILRVHTEEYIRRAERLTSNGNFFFDNTDTIISQHSLDAAFLAAGAGPTAADEIMKGNYKFAFCAVRPPGHHAEQNTAMGFCIFNNIAITARYLQAKHKIKKVLIVDWDVHHGNGTEKIFYDDDSVFYISIHQYPHYPGTGAANDIGVGRGLNCNLNIPMAAGSGDHEYLNAFKEKIIPTIKNFAPEIILISSGFDAHHDDQLSAMRVTTKCFGTFTKMVKDASSSANGRIISFLEGGYHYKALSESVIEHLTKAL